MRIQWIAIGRNTHEFHYSFPVLAGASLAIPSSSLTRGKAVGPYARCDRENRHVWLRRSNRYAR
jgi:hypothetical protein